MFEGGRVGKALRYGGLIAFGGSTSYGASWDGAAWTDIGPQLPGGRSTAAYASTPNGPALVFGGWAFSYGGSYHEYYDDTWSVEWRE